MTEDLTGVPLIRTSERSTFGNCQFEWNLRYNDRLAPAHRGTALEFGSLIHSALEAYYIPGVKRGPHPAATFLEEYDRLAEESGYDRTVRDEDGEWADMRELGESMMVNYVDHWREEDEQIRVVAPEMAMMSVIRNAKGEPVARYLSQVDMVVEHLGLGRYLFFDHKTAKSIPDEMEKDYDEQASTYWALGPPWLKENGYLPEDVEIEGFLFNYIRKAEADDRPENAQGQKLNKPKKADLIAAAEEHFVDLPAKATVAVIREHLEEAGLDPDVFGEVSKTQPPPLFARYPTYRTEAERENTIIRIRKQIYEMDLKRRGKLPIWKHITSFGFPTCRNCGFFDLCVMHEEGNEGWRDLLGLEYVEHDPYEQYRAEDINTEEAF